MSSYIYFTDDQEQRASAADLEDFLMRQGERLLRPGREKCLNNDHNITVRGNEWHDHATREGGFTIDFVQIFYGRSFPNAATVLLDGEQGQPYRPRKQREPEPSKPFVLPKAHSDTRRVLAYLTKARCLGRSVASAFARAESIHEDSQYRNAVSVGMDRDGVACRAHKRGTYMQGDVFKGNVDGCDPKYSFHFTGQSNTVYVFEAPINLLFFISLYQRGWGKRSYVALCGMSERALTQYLVGNPQVQKIGLCLDHDKANIQTRERIERTLSEWGYRNVFSLFSHQKGWNKDLQVLREQAAPQTTKQKKTI